MAGMGLTAAQIAPRIKDVLEAADLGDIAALLDPNVRWGAPGDPDQTCQNREQVIAWFQRGRDAGVRAKVTESTVYGDKLLVGMRVTGRQDSSDRWQVMTVATEGISEIVGFDNQLDAALYLTASS
jgi:hypothetical protein